jgi:Retinoic acid induced 16-like protein
LENVPSEGRIGDFAKTGILYFIELASPDGELEEWILSSDLATMMAAGYMSIKLPLTTVSERPIPNSRAR